MRFFCIGYFSIHADFLSLPRYQTRRLYSEIIVVVDSITSDLLSVNNTHHDRISRSVRKYNVVGSSFEYLKVPDLVYYIWDEVCAALVRWPVLYLVPRAKEVSKYLNTFRIKLVQGAHLSWISISLFGLSLIVGS